MPEFTVAVVHHGSGTISLDGGAIVEIPAGSAVLFPLAGRFRADHRGCAPPGTCASTIRVPLARELVENASENTASGIAARPLRLTRTAFTELLLLAVCGARGANRARDQNVGAWVWGALVGGHFDANSEHARLARGASELLAASFSDPLHLPALARQLGCSSHHLCRVFRGEFGRTLSEHLLDLRIAEAIRRLMAGERTLGVLAADLGFASHSHFSTAFRRVTGLTPSAFRREIQSMQLGGRRDPPP